MSSFLERDNMTVERIIGIEAKQDACAKSAWNPMWLPVSMLKADIRNRRHLMKIIHERHTDLSTWPNLTEEGQLEFQQLTDQLTSLQVLQHKDKISLRRERFVTKNRQKFDNR